MGRAAGPEHRSIVTDGRCSGGWSDGTKRTRLSRETREVLRAIVLGSAVTIAILLGAWISRFGRFR
jgi:hypothetical protein